MNAQTPHSQFTFQLPSMSYVDASWEEPSLRHPPIARRRRSGLGAWLAECITAFRGWWQERQALAQLRGMTDRELMDIGLRRADLDRVLNPALNADLRSRGRGD